jgi:hypothetical protein
MFKRITLPTMIRESFMRAGHKPLYMLLAAVLLAGALSSTAGAAPDGFEISTQPSYFSGKFGTPHPIHIYYVPVDLVYADGPATIRVTIPYISVTGQGILSGGTVIGTTGSRQRRNGLGDIWITGKYRFHTLNGPIPDIVPYLKVKLPTASRKMGLGTGQPDEEFGGFFQWRIGSRIFPFAKFGYRIVGRSKTLKLGNAAIYEFGSTFVMAPKQYLTLLTTGHPAIQRNFGPIEDLLIAYNCLLTRGLGLQLYVDKGLTKSSPAFGLGGGLMMHF